MEIAIASAPVEFRALAEQVRSAGLLRRRPWRACARIALTVAAFAVGWAALFLIGDSWAALGPAAFLAVMSTQVLFIGHDAGHKQLFSSRRGNQLVGLVIGNLLTGLSYSWWVPKHNAHHAYPNQVGRDPDIGPLPAGALLGPPRRRRWLVWLASPLLLLEVGMHLSSMKALARRRGGLAVTEWLLLAGNAALYLTAVFSLLDPLRAVVFVAVQQGLFGLYLRVCFAPNHKGMPLVDPDGELGFAQRQVITARNVTGGWLTSFVLGGLNYQIEHHLFPTMPRANLHAAQGPVRAFCASSGLAYCEASPADSYRAALRSILAARHGGDLVPAAGAGVLQG